MARTDIPERIDAVLGIVRERRPEKAQYLLDHKPKNHALQYYNLGKRIFLSARSPSGELRGGVPEQAIDRLNEAIRRDPDFFRPYLLQAIIFNAAGIASGGRVRGVRGASGAVHPVERSRRTRDVRPCARDSRHEPRWGLGRFGYLLSVVHERVELAT